MVTDILAIWFGEFDDAGMVTSEVQQRWWRKSTTFDQDLTNQFGEILTRAANHEFDHWQLAPQSCLALVILLDQFSRHVYRGMPQMYAQDGEALRIACQAIEQDFHQHLLPIQAAFLFMPLEHAETLAMQHRCVMLFEQLVERVEPTQASLFNGFVEFARQHQVVIEQFGRFPHRNAILQRSSTDEELVFLQQPGSSF
ncbi:MAG: DUF924 family protein [Legionellales bacterium]|nr:DUF924 family protein [Legionellales bacterium]